MKHLTPDEALVKLQEKYPSIEWKLHKSNNTNEEKAYGLSARIADHKVWINVFSEGCTAKIIVKQQPISKSPDEQGKSFDEALAYIESYLSSLITK